MFVDQRMLGNRTFRSEVREQSYFRSADQHWDRTRTFHQTGVESHIVWHNMLEITFVDRACGGVQMCWQSMWLISYLLSKDVSEIRFVVQNCFGNRTC